MFWILYNWNIYKKKDGINICFENELISISGQKKKNMQLEEKALTSAHAVEDLLGLSTQNFDKKKGNMAVCENILWMFRIKFSWKKSGLNTHFNQQFCRFKLN